MAAAVKSFLQIPNNISQGTWNWGDVALGFRAGLLPTQLCLRALQFTPSIYFEGDGITPIKNAIPYNVATVTTHGRVLGIARTEHFILQNLKTLQQIYFASLLINQAAQMYHKHIQHKQNSSTREKKLASYILQSTPFIMLLINAALSILELRSNRMKATVSLAVTSLALLDSFGVMPRAFGGYLNPGLRIPLDLMALYYSNNRDRFAIAAGWVEIPFVQRQMINLVGHRFSWIVPILRIPAAFLWRV